jgi:hypothetical protein
MPAKAPAKKSTKKPAPKLAKQTLKPAKPPKPAKPTPAKTTEETGSGLTSRGLEHGHRAFGARFVRPGRARTPELDLAFALGHGGGGIAAMQLLPDLDPSKKPRWSDTSSFPRNVIVEHIRGEPRTMAPAPIDDEEATRLGRALVGKISAPWMFLGLEAIAGPSITLAAMLDGLEASKERHWDNGGWGSICGPLKGLMLRVPESESKAARDRLAAVWTKWRETHGAQRFDILLHGREGIARSGYKYIAKHKSYGRAPGSTEAPVSAWELTLLDDDEADFIAQQYEALWTAFNWKPQANMMSPASGRLLFLGGDAVMRTELRAVDAYRGDRQVEAFTACADLGGPLAKQLMTKLAAPDSKVHKRARAWLDG